MSPFSAPAALSTAMNVLDQIAFKTMPTGLSSPAIAIILAPSLRAVRPRPSIIVRFPLRPITLRSVRALAAAVPANINVTTASGHFKITPARPTVVKEQIRLTPQYALAMIRG